MGFEIDKWREFLLETVDREPPKRGRPKIDIARALIMKETFRHERTGEYHSQPISVLTLHEGNGPAVANTEVDFEKTIQEKATALLGVYLGVRRAKYAIAQMSDGSYILSRLGPETIVSI